MSKIIKHKVAKKFTKFIDYAGLIFIIFLVPCFLWLLIRNDPTAVSERFSSPLSFWLLVIIYLGLCIYSYNCRERAKDRTWQLAQFLNGKWTTEKRETEISKLTSNVIFMDKLKNECPEAFED